MMVKVTVLAETIGQSIKGILARVQALKENGFDETDGTKVSAVAKALNAVGVQLMDDSGQFRNFGKVMDDLGSVWGKLDSRQRAYIATTVAGTYQQSRFLNLMEGYSDSVSLYTKSLDSAGISEKKFQQYQQGTEAQLNKLKASWESVWMSAFKSNDLQTLIGGLNGIANSLKFTVQHMGILSTTMGVATTAFLLFNTTGIKVRSLFSILPVAIARTSSATQGFALAARFAGFNIKGLSLSLASLKKVGLSSLGFLGGAILPIAGIMLLTAGISKLTESVINYNQKQKEIKQEQNDIVKKYSSHSDKIKELASDYGNLSAKVKSGEISSSNKDYLSTMNQLGKLMPVLVSKTDEHGNSILRNVDAVKEELDYAQKLKENYDAMTVANFEKDLDKQSSKVDEILSKIQKGKDSQQGMSYSSSHLNDEGYGTLADEGKRLQGQRDAIQNERELQLILSQSKDYIKAKSKAFMDMEGTTEKLSKADKKLVQSYIDESVANKKNIKDGDDLKKFLSDTTNGAADLAKILAKIPKNLDGVFSGKDASGLNDKQLSTIKSVSKEVKNGGKDWKDYRKELKSAGLDADIVSAIIDKLKDSQKKGNSATKDAKDEQAKYAAQLKETIDAEMEKATAEEQIVGSTQNLITKAKEQIAIYQMLSAMQNRSAEQDQALADAKQYLAGIYPNLVNGEELAIAAMSKETEQQDILLKAITDTANGQATAEETKTLNAALAARARLQIMSAEIAALQKLMQTYEDAANHQIAMAQATGDEAAYIQAQKFHNAQVGTAADIARAQKALQAMIPSFDGTFNKLAAQTGYKGNSYSAPNKTSSSGSGSSSSKDDKIEKTIKPYETAISDLDKTIRQADATQERYNEGSASWIKLQKQKISYTQSQKTQSEKEEAALQKLLKTGKLDKEQKAEVLSRIKELNAAQAEYTTTINEMNEALAQAKIDSTVSAWEKSINSLDESLKQADAQLQHYKEGSVAWNNVMKTQISLLSQKASANQKEIDALKLILKNEKLSTEQKDALITKIKELTTTQLEYVNAVADADAKIRESQTNAKIAETEKLYNAQITALQKKLDLMDAEAKKQDRLNQLADINAQIAKAKSDTSHEYIDKNGNITYTYDKTAVAELEKQKTDLQTQWKDEDARAALEKQIADAEKNRDAAIAKLQKLQEDYLTKSYNNTTDLANIMKQFLKDLATTYNAGIVNVPKHHSGGIVGSSGTSSSSNLTKLVNSLFNVQPNEEVVKALKGEVMVPQANFPNFLTNMQNFANSLVGNNAVPVDNSTKLTLNNVTIKTENASTFLNDLDMIIRMNKT